MQHQQGNNVTVYIKHIDIIFKQTTCNIRIDYISCVIFGQLFQCIIPIAVTSVTLDVKMRPEQMPWT